MQSDWITTYLAVVDEGGFSAAARALFRSQGRVSGHVHDLERELGVTLFDRHRRPVELTPAGEAFLEYARSISSYIEAGRTAAVAMRGLSRGQVALGTFPSAGELFIAPVLATFRRTHPSVAVRLVEEAVVGLDAALVHGDVAVAVRPWRPLLPAVGIDRMRLWRESVQIVVPPDHRLASWDGRVPLTELAEEPLVITGRQLHHTSWAYQMLAGQGLDPRVSHVTDQPQILVGLVTAGFGVGVTNQLSLRTLDTSHLRVLDLTPPLHREVGLFWKSAVTATETAARALLREMLRAPLPDGTEDLRDRDRVRAIVAGPAGA